jgi:hypothetical protein
MNKDADSQDRGAAQSPIICSDPTPAEIVGGPLDGRALWQGKSLGGAGIVLGCK